MPYFIYRITERPIRMLEKIEQHDSYRTASARTKELRAEQDGAPAGLIRMIHAETELHAEDLLNQIREKEPGPGDD